MTIDKPLWMEAATGDSPTGYRYQPKHAVETRATDGSHDHRPVQHRDGKPPWCKLCGLTDDGDEPTSMFGGSRNG